MQPASHTRLERRPPQSWLGRLGVLLPEALWARFTLLLISAVFLAQLLSAGIWVTQIKHRHEQAVVGMANQIAYSMGSTVRFFKQLPSDYRHIVLDQLRRMGGSRFFVTFNSEYIEIDPIPDSKLKVAVLEEVTAVLRNQLGRVPVLRSEFSFASSLHVFNNDIRLMELPPGWGHHSILLEANSTPILVVQVGLADDEWLYLATLIPTPDGQLEGDTLLPGQLWFMGLTVVMVVLLSLLAVRWLTRPLKKLEKAAEELGHDIERPPLEERGAREMRAAARAFNLMQESLKRYINDRGTLFSAISHDLKTPITRLRLRAEMLEDELQREKFVADLEELETMVHGALQCVKDTAIDETPRPIDLAAMLQSVCEGANVKDARVTLEAENTALYWGKPLSLKRVFTNLVDNAVFYGGRADVTLTCQQDWVVVTVRDYGPGVPEDDLQRIFDPFVRLETSRSRYTGGTGLGLSIVRNIIHAHGGLIEVGNHPQKGFLVHVRLPPAAPPDAGD